MKKILSVVSLVCVLNVLALLGVLGYLFATGRMDGVKTRVMADLVRHQGTPTKLREQMHDILEPRTAATSGPASQNALASGGKDMAAGGEAGQSVSAQERIDFTRQAMEQERIRLENQAQDLRHRQELLVQLQASVETTLKKIETEKREFEPRVAAAEAKAKGESFQKMLALYDELKTKQVKDIFIDSKNVEQVALYLAAMDPSRAAKIIGEFKTEDERKFINLVLDRIRANGTCSASGSPVVGGVTAVAPGP